MTITIRLYRGPYANHVADIEWADDFPLPQVGDFVAVSVDEDDFKVCARKFEINGRTISLYEH